MSLKNLDERRLIPRLRSFKSTVNIAELLPAHSATAHPNPAEFSLESQSKSWNLSKNVFTAGDLISGAYVAGVENKFHDIAHFILQSDVSSAIQKKFAGKVLGLEEPYVPPTLDNVDLIFSRDRYYGEIRDAKMQLRLHPREPFALMDLARLYSIIGEVPKAMNFTRQALAIDSDNRFIVRSASRLYHHYAQDPDKALRVIKNSKFLESDPWLLSCDIAYSTIMGRFSKAIRPGKAYLERASVDLAAGSELAGSLGTIELKDGSIKMAKKYFQTSLLVPTDNSLAQAEWFAPDIPSLKIAIEHFNLPLVYEARALDKYRKAQYNESLDFSISWLKDEPYSVRPLLLSSFLAGTMLDMPDLACKILENTIDIHWNEPKIFNNFSYYMAKSGRVDELLSKYSIDYFLRLLDSPNLEVANRISLHATLGMIFFRKSESSKGIKYYREAIRLSNRVSDDKYFVCSAAINFAIELIIAEEHQLVSSSVKEARKIIVGNDDPAIVKLSGDMESLYNSYHRKLHGV